ncbi:MAG TPA: gliding motility-associated C-terminal domain-containing protein [Flavitalea sp.]|nr:gliding motility-associated C-terminal domain-containing protein [Flavitalea sp.]
MVFRGPLLLFLFLSGILLQTEAQTVDFTFPSDICVGKPFNITNYTTGGSTFKWNFCSKDLNQSPLAQNLGGFGMLDQPTYIDIVFTNNNYYAFATNFSSGDLVRLDFGNSLLNTPTPVNLGNVNNVIPAGGNGGIRVVQNEGKWYAVIVAGYPPGGINPRIMKIEFGNNITNLNPTGVDWGNLGNMYDPNDLILVQEGNEWIGLTINGETNSITRFNFTNSFDNSPTGNNLGNLGNLGEPAGLYLTRNQGNTIVFITNSGDKTRIGEMFNITRLNFGTSLNNNPSAVNIGNVGNQLQHPHDIVLAQFCNETLAYVLNAHPFYNSLLKLNFNNDITTSFPESNEISHQAFDYPYSITDFYKTGNDMVAFVVNRGNSTITRLVFADCNNSSLRESNAQNPPAISYDQPGIYNIQLIVNEGTSSEVTLCKQAIIKNCTDTIIITNDTTICAGTSLQISTHPAIKYQWSPSFFLDDPASSTPVTKTDRDIKYYVDALVPGTNLLKNGDFSNGNNDFNSGYSYTPTNVSEGEYFVGNDPRTWNISLDYCSDHTNGNGQMLLVNGSPEAGKTIWSQSVNIKPNTDYAFSAWLQSVWSPNPANLQFYINGVPLDTSLTSTSPPCNWSQFSEIWNSGANTSVTLSIVDLNTAVIGNDFALDDISFTELVPVEDSITIMVKQPFIKASNDTTVCAGSPVQLQVDQGAFFTWSPTTGLSNAGVPNPVATPATTTEYTVIGVDPAGCLARDTVHITVKPSPVVNISNDTSICSGASVQLTASGGGTYQWSPLISLDNPAISNPVSSAVNDITYRVKVIAANSCITEDSVKISVRPYPKFTASSKQTVCAGDPVTITASGGDTYGWSPAVSLQDPSQSTITFVPDASQVYTVNISDNVCHHDTSININVGVNPLPVITIQKSNDINCTEPSAKLKASGAINYLWSPAQSLSNVSIADPVATPGTTTAYVVTAMNESGCVASASVIVKVDRSGTPRFVLPNAFSPDNDGRNDCFGIQRWGNAAIKQFSIYNRWGRLIFQTTHPSQCWDGMWKGKLQDAGGYIYIIRATTLCGDVTRKGMVMLIR